jgi:hypothetical protein
MGFELKSISRQSILEALARNAAARRCAQHVIIARAYASHLWHEARSLRNSIAAR